MLTLGKKLDTFIAAAALHKELRGRTRPLLLHLVVVLGLT